MRYDMQGSTFQILKTWFGIAVFLFVWIPTGISQKYYTKSGRVTFISQAPLEKIESTNQNAYVVLDAATGQVECSVLIKGFQFEKSLMQQHFNENYLESHKYPKGIFKGQVSNMQDINLTKDGSYKAMVKGNLTLHGVTKPLNAMTMITVKGGNVATTTSFEVVVSDFSIDIPKVVADNIAEKVKVTLSADLQKMP